MKNCNGKVLNLENVKKEIEEVLCKFQEGYSKRDVSIIKEYAEELISKDEDTFAVGTGDDEWCFGWEEVKELVESDWQYWGDFTLDTKSPIISIDNDIVWLAAKGSVKYEFDHEDETFERYFELVKEMLKGEGEFSKLSLKEKLTEANYIITHKITHRKEMKRRYNWPVTFTGALINQDGKWKFKYMQFSMPTHSMYPDIRYNTTQEYENAFEELKGKMKAFRSDNGLNVQNTIEGLLEKLQSSYINKNISVKNVMKDLFSMENSNMLIEADGSYKVGTDQIEEAIETNREKWDGMTLDVDESVISVNGDIAWFATNGMAIRKIDKNQVLEDQVKATKRYFDNESSAKENLFRIQRDISIMQKELSKGENFVWPFRLEGFMVKRNEKWLFQTMQISYPFMMILEGKYDVEEL